MAKTKKQVFDGPFQPGDKLKTTKPINKSFEGQVGLVVECTPKCVVVEFETGQLAGDPMKVPYHAVELVMTAKKIARKAADKAARDSQ